MMETVERIRHIKRGTTYRVIARGELQWSGQAMIEGTRMVLYQSEQDHRFWVRPEAQIDDPTRFEKLEHYMRELDCGLVWIVQGKHPYVSGVVRRIYGSIESANKEAADLVNLIRKDTFELDMLDDPEEAKKWCFEARPDNWAQALEKLQHTFKDYYDSDEFYVEVTTEEVKP